MGICLALYILEPVPVNTAKHGLELVDSSRLWEPVLHCLSFTCQHSRARPRTHSHILIMGIRLALLFAHLFSRSRRRYRLSRTHYRYPEPVTFLCYRYRSSVSISILSIPSLSIFSRSWLFYCSRRRYCSRYCSFHVDLRRRRPPIPPSPEYFIGPSSVISNVSVHVGVIGSIVCSRSFRCVICQSASIPGLGF